MKWNPSHYLGEHEWVHYNDVSFSTWDRYAVAINEHGVNEKKSFRGNKPKTYRYWTHEGYRYWIVGCILNRAKL